MGIFEGLSKAYDCGNHKLIVNKETKVVLYLGLCLDSFVGQLCDNAKFLVITLDMNLSWLIHVDLLSKKLKICYSIAVLKNYINDEH